MSLHLKAGRLTIDQDGRTVFDTDDKLYHNITTGLSGNFLASAHQSSGLSKVNIDTNHLIGTCNPFCTHLAGSVKFTGQRYSIPSDIWFSYEGGDLFWGMLYMSGQQNPAYSKTMEGLVKYRFFISGTNVYLNERVAMRTSVSTTIPSHRVYWKLKAGRFT